MTRPSPLPGETGVPMIPALKTKNGCIDFVYSPDDGGWYAQEYDFSRKDHATRTSVGVYGDPSKLEAALNTGKHRWQRWD